MGLSRSDTYCKGKKKQVGLLKNGRVIMENKMLVDAYSFFEGESNEFKQEMAVEDLLVDIACEFINFRVKNKMSQKDLAEKLQITQAMVSKLESGEYNPTVKMLFEIAQKLSWKFNIQFESGIKSEAYNFEQIVSEPNEEYIDSMGFAS